METPEPNSPNTNASSQSRNDTQGDPSPLGGTNGGKLFDVSGILGGFSQILNQLGSLAEKGEQLKRATQDTSSPTGKPIAGSIGYTVNFGGESFSGRRNDSSSSSPAVEPLARNRQATTNAASERKPVTKEPTYEAYDELDAYVIILEMPGVAAEAIHLDSNGSKLTIRGVGRQTNYEVTLELPMHVQFEQPIISANNGIVEVRLPTVSK